MSDDSNESWSSSGGEVGSDPSPASDDVVSEPVSFWETLMQSLTGVLVGLVLVAGSAWGLWWNEGRAVQTERALTEGAGLAVTVPADRIDRGYDGKLVHVSGDARTTAELRDDLGVAVRGLRLTRKVEMYQWREESRTETRDGQRMTTYSYNRVWSDTPIDSSRFRRRDGHENRPMPLRSRTALATDARLGAFVLSEAVIGLLSGSTERRLTESDEALRPALARLGLRARFFDGAIYVGNDGAAPEIGDMRITFQVLPVGPVSVAARQHDGGFASYRASNGREILLAETGLRSSAELFQHAQDANTVLTWVLRAVALLVMLIAWALVFRPFVVLAEVVPILGAIVGAGAGIAALLLTLLVGLPVMAIAWLWFRPLVGLALIAAGVLGGLGVRYLAARRVAARAAKGPPAAMPTGGASVPFVPAGTLPPRR